MADTKSNLTAKQARTLKVLAGKYNTKTAEADALRSQLDVLVFEARNEGGKFREIANIADRSVAWVQGSLERTKKKFK